MNQLGHSSKICLPHQTADTEILISEKAKLEQHFELVKLLGDIVMRLERLEQELWVQDSQELR